VSSEAADAETLRGVQVAERHRRARRPRQRRASGLVVDGDGAGSVGDGGVRGGSLRGVSPRERAVGRAQRRRGRHERRFPRAVCFSSGGGSGEHRVQRRVGGVGVAGEVEHRGERRRRRGRAAEKAIAGFVVGHRLAERFRTLRVLARGREELRLRQEHVARRVFVARRARRRERRQKRVARFVRFPLARRDGGGERGGGERAALRLHDREHIARLYESVAVHERHGAVVLTARRVFSFTPSAESSKRKTPAPSQSFSARRKHSAPRLSRAPTSAAKLVAATAIVTTSALGVFFDDVLHSSPSSDGLNPKTDAYPIAASFRRPSAASQNAAAQFKGNNSSMILISAQPLVAKRGFALRFREL
jgi:hypothetical protein